MDTSDEPRRDAVRQLVADIEAGAAAPAVLGRLRSLPIRDLGTAHVQKLGRALGSVDWGRPPLKVAYLSNLTVSELVPYVALWSWREGIPVEPWIAPIGQHMQQLADPSSELRAWEPDVVVILLEPRLLRSHAFERFATLSTDARRDLAEEVLGEVMNVVEGIIHGVGATAIVSNFVPSARPGAGVADTKLPLGETEFFARLNLDLLRSLRSEPSAQLLDLQRCMAAAGRAAYDPRRFYLAKMAWTGPAPREIGEEIARHLCAATGRARKCVVVDLDNTLWAGVVGEDGVNGIRIGAGDPVGEAYADVQRVLLELKQRGILLAISSKNNPADVEEVFERRSMLLSLDDFAAAEIHWQPKHESLLAIARALNIGVDSLVFIDDNPAEVALVNEALPEVRTVLLDGDPALFPERIADELAFEKGAVLEEDLGKTQQYRQQRSREHHRESVGDLEDYLGSLETVARIRPASLEDLPRLHQMFTKTNQFNLTTRRHAMADLRGFLSDPDYQVVIWDVEDRFGHLGTVGAYVTRRRDSVMEIDSFLMSCRAMGRKVEAAVMNHLKRQFLTDPSATRLEAMFIPTPKNVPVQSFYDDQGFTRVPRGGGRHVKAVGSDEPGPAAVCYVLTQENVRPVPCDWITVEEGIAA